MATLELGLDFLRFYLEKSSVYLSLDEAKQVCLTACPLPLPFAVASLEASLSSLVHLGLLEPLCSQTNTPSAQVWQDLVDDAQSEVEREMAYDWMEACFGPEGDLEMADQYLIFKDKIIKGIRPTEMSLRSLRLFWSAFLGANSHAKRLLLDHAGGVSELSASNSLFGEEVLWQALQTHPDEEVALLAKHLIQELYQAEMPKHPHPLLARVFQSISQPFLELERVKVRAKRRCIVPGLCLIPATERDRLG